MLALNNKLTYLDWDTVEDIYRPDKIKEAVQVLGADDIAHPSVAYLHNRAKELYVGGKVQAIQPPTHFDYVALRCTCRKTRNYGCKD
jgi:sulfate adenylyltransferase